MSRAREDEIFLEVCHLEPDERRQRLDELCGEDRGLRASVEALLRHDDPDDDWLADVAESVARAADERSPAVPESVGAFRVLKRIGTGGMGTVYLAEQDHPRRRVALKMIRAGLLSREVRKRFRVEAELLGRLQHPGIAQIHDAGETGPEDGGRPWFAMEYVEGPELRDHAEGGELDRRDRLELIARVADAVHHAHTRGVVHRDLKPENILVVPDADGGPGQPKILDFGVARAVASDVQLTTMHTSAEEILGTLNYMSPEQIAGRHDEVDGRSDVYALGVILYELLTGRLPCDLRGKSVVEAALAVERETPVRLGTVQPALRGDVETIAGKALEKEIGRRYASAAELAADLRRHLQDEPIAARPPSRRYLIHSFARRHRGLVIGTAAAFLILIAGVVVSTSLAIRAGNETRRAEAREAEARRATYRFSLAAAEAVCDTDPRRALRHLAEAPEELRGFEWRLIEARCRPHIARARGTTPLRDGPVVARDADGRLLAALVRGEDLEVVELASGALRGRFPAPGPGGVAALAPDGSRMAVWSAEARRLVVRRVRDGTVLFEQSIDLATRTGPCFSPDGRRLAIPLRGAVRLVEIETGEAIYAHETLPDVEAIALDPRDGHLVVASADREKDGDQVRVDALGADGRVTATAIHAPQCRALAVGPGGQVAFGARRRVHLLDGASLARVSTPIWTGDQVKVLAFSADGLALAVGVRGAKVRVLDLETGASRALLLDGGPSSVAFSGDGSRLAAGTTADVLAWETAPAASRVLEGHESYVYQVAFDAEGARLASSDFQGHVLVHDRWTGATLCRGTSSRAWAFLAFARESGDLLVGRGKRVARHDPCTFLERGSTDWETFTASTVADRSWCLDYGWGRLFRDRDGGWSVLYMSEGSVIVRRDGVEVRRIPIPDGDLVTGVALSPDRAFLLTGHLDGTVRRFDLETGVERTRAGGHDGRVWAIVYAPDGSRVATGAEDGLVLIRDATTLEVLLRLDGHHSYVHGLAFSPDGRALASASGDGTVRLWESTRPSERPADRR